MKMKLIKKMILPVMISLLGLAFTSASAATITQWTFEGLSTSGVNASPATAAGSGAASTVGMALYTGPENSGIATLAGTDGTNNGAGNLTWKVRGSNGWNTAAAIGTQGAQFSVNTTGYTGISASFDWYPSTKGEAKLLIQYTTDGTTWINASASDITIPTVGTLSLNTNSSSSNTVMGAYINTTAGNTWYNGITLNLSGISAADNDANFGFRLLNASTGTDNVQATGGTALDNTAGNWSFDNVKISGTAATPEPSTYALMMGGLVALVGFQLMRRNKIA